MRLFKLFVAGFLVFSSAGGALYWVARGLVGPTSSKAALAEAAIMFLLNILVASLAGRWWRRVYRTGRGNEGGSHRSQPEDEVSVAMTEPAGKGRISQTGPSQEAVQPIAKTASPTKAREYRKRTGTKAVLVAYGATVFTLSVIAVPWVHYEERKDTIVGSGYAPIWSPPVWKESYPDEWIGPEVLQNFNNLSASEQDDALNKYQNEHRLGVRNLLIWFRSQPKDEREEIIARLRKNRQGYPIKGDFKGTYRREINPQGLLLELLGVSALAGVGVVLTTFFRRQDR